MNTKISVEWSEWREDRTPLATLDTLDLIERPNMPAKDATKSHHRNLIDLAGQIFGRLYVIERAGRDRFRTARWKCRCECGEIRIVLGSSLRSGNTKSCGCLPNPSQLSVGKRSTTHGRGTIRDGKQEPIYRTWSMMLTRCFNPRATRYHDYGGRGITVCERWHRFENFLEDMGERPPGTTLDRIDNNAGYSPENCRWADRKTQGRNARTNRMVTFRGQTKCLSEWAEQLKIDRGLLTGRLWNGWSPERAFTTPVRPMRKRSKAME